MTDIKNIRHKCPACIRFPRPPVLKFLFCQSPTGASMKRLPLILAALILIGGGFTIKMYNGLQRADESVAAAWAEVENQYQRRADLVPNLVATVKGYAAHEQATLAQVVEARSRASGVHLSAEQLNDPAALERYRAAQSELGNGLARLLAVAESYPDLKANASFQDLQRNLTDTENKIVYARQSFNDCVLMYNNAIETFPGNIVAGSKFKVRQGFEVTDVSARQAPQVQF